MDTSSSQGRAVAPGVRLADRYELHDLLATGGMAQVWRALDLTLDRWVAIKILHGHLADDASFVARFRHEARAAARLNHRCIVSVYDTVSTDHVDAIVMELVRGLTLRERLEQQGSIRPARAVEIAADVADALHAAHLSGIVHRDVKPANIMLADDGRVLVADFGIAKAEGAGDLTATGSVLGTAKYVAPEQLRGEHADPRTDVYALGAVLYEMLTGAPPFDSDTEAATALARLHRDPPSLADHDAVVPQWLDSVVTKALDRRPDHRFADAATMAEALRQGTAVDPGAPLVQPDDSTTVLDLAPPQRDTSADTADAAAPRTGRRLMPLILFLLLCGIAASVAVMLFNDDADDGATGDGGATVDAGSASLPLALIAVAEGRSFDPLGTGTPGENDSLVPLALDNDPESAWRTEGYRSATMDPKDGVGYQVSLDQPASVSAMELTSQSDGWDASIYAAAEPGASLDAWGAPVATVSGGEAGTTTITFEPVDAGHLLIWFTKLAPDEDRFRVRLAEIDVFG
ncbi:MAG: protein kinase [Acidimicrobiales bacterium]